MSTDELQNTGPPREPTEKNDSGDPCNSSAWLERHVANRLDHDV